MQIFSDQAVGWFPGTSDMYKQLLLKKFFQTMQKRPYQVQFKFRTLQSKSKKKSFACLIKFHFFLQNWAPFGETIPKMYNTWGHVARNLP